MATLTPELQEILGTLDRLRARVEVLSTDSQPPATTTIKEVPRVLAAADNNGHPHLGETNPMGLDPANLALLHDGITTLNLLQKPREFPEFFSRFVRQSGLRLLLLKRWTSGLQVYLEVGIKLPSEARRKRSDGRAPIPLNKGDVFTAVAEETAVYAGPVPARNFPLDLTLMLGRGARERQIVILPLPSQGHWNTFLYMDGVEDTRQSLAVAEILANYALTRMYLLEKGVHLRQGRVESILKSELARRENSLMTPKLDSSPPPSSQPQENPVTRGNVGETNTESDSQQNVEVDPFQVLPPKKVSPAVSTQGPDGSRTKREAVEPHDTTPDPQPASFSPTHELELTPEGILQHSGELPALPKAACHIMAVIEDPKTTATRLEKALAMDQTLTAKVLRIANSPFYGAVREIKTVSESIVRLGFVAIRNWTLVTAARSVFLAPGAGALYHKIWQQSVMSAMAGQLVAQSAGLRDPESVFIGGLMQNIGQLVLARSHPELFQEILLESTSSGKPYHVLEREIMGFDHGELGANLIREWNLSRDLEEAVRWHHRFLEPEARNTQIAAMIALGEEIAWCSGGGGDDNRDPEESAEKNGEWPVGEAALFLRFSPSKIEELSRQAASLKIDPHFFS